MRMTLKRLGPLGYFLCAMVFVAGCGDDEGGANNPILGCDRGNSCIDFGSAFSQQGAADNCDGSVLQGPCGRTNAVGSCQLTLSGFTVTELYFSSGWDANTGSIACEDGGGSWTPQ
jgi:hypothetical protein